jgi:hypothetical protein
VPSLLRNVRLRGDTGSIVYGYHEAASLRAWTIVHHEPDATHAGSWQIVATFARVDKFCLRQRPLLFTAKRDGLKGLWCWPLDTRSIQIGETRLIATLGPPER